MPSKKQIKEQLDIFIFEAIKQKSQMSPAKKSEGLIYALGYLEGVLIDALYESPGYVQRSLLDRLDPKHLNRAKRRY